LLFVIVQNLTEIRRAGILQARQQRAGRTRRDGITVLATGVAQRND
jgi:hypothetical protein